MPSIGNKQQDGQEQTVVPFFISFGINGILKTVLVTFIFSLTLFPILQIIILKLLQLLSNIDMHNLKGLTRTTRLLAASLSIGPLVMLLSPLFSFYQLKKNRVQQTSILLKFPLKNKKFWTSTPILFLITILCFIIFYGIISLFVYLSSTTEEGRVFLADETLLLKVIIGLFIFTNFAFQFFLIAIVIFQHYFIYYCFTIKKTASIIKQIVKSHWLYLGLLCNIIIYMIGILFFFYKDVVNWILNTNLAQPNSISLTMIIGIHLLFIFAAHILVSLFLGAIYKTINTFQTQSAGTMSHSHN